MIKVNVAEKLSLFDDHWNPKIVGELNGQHVKFAKLKGEFVWHTHDAEDEMFYVLDGLLKIAFRDGIVELEKNEFIIIPKGTEHKPIAESEVSVMLFEPAGTINTGNAPGHFTKENLDKI